MKTSRILCSLFMLGALCGNESAAVIETNQCYSTSEQGVDYTVYFENDRPKSNEANKTYRGLNQTFKTDCVDDLESTLARIRATNTDNCIFLIGSADKSNDQTLLYNTDLSLRRLAVVYKMLNDAVSNSDCVRTLAAGASNSYNEGNTQYLSDHTERVVRIIITKKDTVFNATQDVTLQVTNNINNTTTNEFINTTTVLLDNTQAAANQKRIDIVSLVSDLKNMNNSFDRSHWKTASGNFNGARLASDSIAGVVLGTAGGLITSKIIKKNQLKGGFEDLHCAIGGQVVADYNDEFTTGIDLNK